ncbi:hypothetical protein V7150_25800 [Neobacillus drentensis]|uniref:Uncharacterized protein n=1 Tax=Neobacillus rhizosphaerae TaxID=2880965 RepID=A0ABN8KYA1_9BACI|nr:hypothetical protein [Neobacillus rhizosphaerae]CAH2717545.1 hypothetical protein BACCIP111895_04759 [Neobacillus rhizosphaerae]
MTVPNGLKDDVHAGYITNKDGIQMPIPCDLFENADKVEVTRMQLSYWMDFILY